MRINPINRYLITLFASVFPHVCCNRYRIFLSVSEAFCRTNSANNLPKSSRNISTDASPACARAMTTQSQLARNSGLWRRKNSRNCRLTRLRTTELPTLRLTVIPNRELSRSVLRVKSKKKRPPSLRPEEVTVLNSIPSNNRRDLAKPSSACLVAPLSEQQGSESVKLSSLRKGPVIRRQSDVCDLWPAAATKLDDHRLWPCAPENRDSDCAEFCWVETFFAPPCSFFAIPGHTVTWSRSITAR